jgi:redox-sensitive bicupin YhaK (pirin superfamily)
LGLFLVFKYPFILQTFVQDFKHNAMKTVVHKAQTRGHANHGWLDSNFSFSFANYYNPERMNFGALRVLNDDMIKGGMGFGTHPHDNMEIISIPLEGDLEHRDSMGNVAVIRQGDIQVMSAGTGIYHSEYNKNPGQDGKFLQIWIIPRERNVTPRYDQISIKDVAEPNTFYQILSPNKDDQGVWIHQDAWFSMGEFEKDTSLTYTLNKKGNGVYAFIIKGDMIVEGESLSTRDAVGIWATDTIDFIAATGTKVLLMEVPMTF